jgi:hypothetical protein
LIQKDLRKKFIDLICPIECSETKILEAQRALTIELEDEEKYWINLRKFITKQSDSENIEMPVRKTRTEEIRNEIKALIEQRDSVVKRVDTIFTYIRVNREIIKNLCKDLVKWGDYIRDCLKCYEKLTMSLRRESMESELKIYRERISADILSAMEIVKSHYFKLQINEGKDLSKLESDHQKWLSGSPDVDRDFISIDPVVHMYYDMINWYHGAVGYPFISAQGLERKLCEFLQAIKNQEKMILPIWRKIFGTNIRFQCPAPLIDITRLYGSEEWD